MNSSHDVYIVSGPIYDMLLLKTPTYLLNIKLYNQIETILYNDVLCEMDKEYLANTIKEWLKIDTEIRELQKRQNSLKFEKKQKSADLMAVMNKHSIDCVDIVNGQILYNKKSVKKPISQKGLTSLISMYFNDDVEKGVELSKYLSDNRTESVKESITHKTG